MTLCPGKYQPQSMSGGWDRDLDLDIKELKGARVGHVISLITIEEIRELKVTSLGNKLQMNEITWHHLPTPDTEVPSEEWMIESLRLIVKLMPNFYSGERVVVHCKGGISRAGIFTCLALWIMGHDEMEDAIDLVRMLRDSRGINQKQEQNLLYFAENYQTWIQGMCQLEQWQEGMR
jgi:ADP-ribosyl-[dinitrogen reductase] hydrolase